MSLIQYQLYEANIETRSVSLFLMIPAFVVENA